MRNSFGLSRVARNAVSGRKIWVDRDLGYPVFRSRRPWEDVADLPRPTVAVVQNGPMVDFATAFARIGVPSVAYLLGLGFQSWRVDGAAKVRDYVVAKVPLKRASTAEDVAALVCFLATPPSSNMTGEVVRMDAGAHLVT